MAPTVEKDDYGSVPNDVYRRRSSLEVYKTFLGEFNAATGAKLVVFLGFLSVVGIGCLVGVIPQVVTQLFAEKSFGLAEGIDCNDIAVEDKPLACIQGSDYAQSAASYSALAKNLLALFTNSLAGTYSDVHGRRGIQILALFLTLGSPVTFLAIQICGVHPIWFYVLESFSGMISPFSIAFTQLSDVLPPKHRAPAFGLYFGCFMAGIAVAPYLGAIISHTGIAIFSLAIRLLALTIAILFLPETLSKKSQMEAAAIQETEENKGTVWETLLQPIRALAILQRSSSLQLVAFGAFLSKMVFSADVTLFFYYIESNLGATALDAAAMMFTTGVLGFLVQAGFLKYLISLMGERRLLIASFGFGVLHNLVYGLATNKSMIYIGLGFSALSNTNNTLLSSLASRMATSTEQGQIQGALFGLTSVAEAIGPLIFNSIYRNWHTFGPGTMFVVGAMLYGVGMVALSLIPPKASTGEEEDEVDETLDGSEEEQQGLFP